MKKYIPIDFDEKGKVILGNAKNTTTSNGFIPTTWVPGGGSEEEGNGIKSISISPAISTTPALESVLPIYWDEERADQGWMEQNINLNTDAPLHIGDEYTVIITPTPDWHLKIDDTEHAAGESVSVTRTTASEGALNDIEYAVSNNDASKGIYGIIIIFHQ